jgi:hypothetical protein
MFVNSLTTTNKIINTSTTVNADINDANVVLTPTATRGGGASNRHFELAVGTALSESGANIGLISEPQAHIGTGNSNHDPQHTSFNYTWPYGTAASGQWPGSGYRYVQLQSSSMVSGNSVVIAVGDLGESGIPAAGHRTQVTWNFVGTGN